MLNMTISGVAIGAAARRAGSFPVWHRANAARAHAAWAGAALAQRKRRPAADPSVNWGLTF
jgi:hypothetical protein